MSDKKLQHERLARYLDVAVPRGDRRWGNAEIEIILKAIDLERAVVEAESADTKWHFNAPAPVPVPSFNFDLTDEQLAKIAEDHRNQPLHVASAHPYAATLPLTAPPATPSAESFSGDDTEPVVGSEDGASDAKASVIHTMISRRDTLTLKSRYGTGAVHIVNMMFKRVQPPRLGYGRKDLLLDFIILSELFAKMQTSSTPCLRTPQLVHAIEAALGDFSGLSDWQQCEFDICLARLNMADLVIITSEKGEQTRYELSPYWNNLARTFWARQR